MRTDGAIKIVYVHKEKSVRSARFFDYILLPLLPPNVIPSSTFVSNA